ncbi:MAG: FtsX-like permease family protein [Patescibacteria group bacterium]
MKLDQIISINTKKLKRKKGKALYLIIPIAFLVMLAIIVSSQVKNTETAVEESVLGTAAEQNTLIKLQPVSEISRGPGRFMATNQNYTENDLATIKSIANVTDADFLANLPINDIKTSDLFTGKTITINELASLNSNFASLYTDQDFNYTAGEPVPIILNANTFSEQTEDWNDQAEITINFSDAIGEPGNLDRRTAMNAGPIKTQSISYDKNGIIGREITLTVGGLDKVATYEATSTSGGITFTKYSDEKIAEEETARKDSIGQYWDYDKIAQPLTYQARVVGVIEDEEEIATFIPADWADKLMTDYIQHQHDARNDTSLDTADLNSTFSGMIYDGTELVSGQFSFGRVTRGFSFGGAQVAPPAGEANAEQSADSYYIPGLVIESQREGSSNVGPFYRAGNVVGEYTDPNIYATAAKTGTVVLVRINDIFNRSQVVSNLNGAGYSYQDVSKTKVIDDVRATLHWVSAVTVIAFIVLTVIIIIFTMSKFVSEGRKEIGIFRAMGATQRTIQKIFAVQGVLYALIGYLAGAVIGLALVPLGSVAMKNLFDSLVGGSLHESFSVVNEVSAGTFGRIDWQTFAIYTGILLATAIVVSLIPSSRAARIDPVEAIKNE